MKTMMDFRMCCRYSMHMTRNEKKKQYQHNNNIYKKQQHEKISIPHSIDLRAAA